MDIGSIIVIVVMAVGFAFAAVFISKNGGWKGEGCQGHCASCDHHCSDPEAMKARLAQKEVEAAAQAAADEAGENNSNIGK